MKCERKRRVKDNSKFFKSEQLERWSPHQLEEKGKDAGRLGIGGRGKIGVQF